MPGRKRKAKQSEEAKPVPDSDERKLKKIKKEEEKEEAEAPQEGKDMRIVSPTTAVSATKGRIFIGVSGYHYDNWRKGIWYPEGLKLKDEFKYYASVFNSVEINNTFYRQPAPHTWKEWDERAPPNFVYAIKASQWFTHRKRFKDVQGSWDILWSGAKLLRKDLLGVFLFQLPANFKCDIDRLSGLAEVLPKDQRFAFEFRHPSWWNEDVYSVLRQNKWCLVILPPCPALRGLPVVDKITAPFTYVRWHGSRGLYEGSYSTKVLSEWADKMKGWMAQGIDVYTYFNNTDQVAAAAKDAETIQRLIRGEDVKETGTAKKVKADISGKGLKIEEKEEGGEYIPPPKEEKKPSPSRFGKIKASLPKREAMEAV